MSPWLKPLLNDAYINRIKKLSAADYCDWGIALECVTKLTQPILHCTSTVANPMNVVTCVKALIGAGHTCDKCLCYVIRKVFPLNIPC